MNKQYRKTHKRHTQTDSESQEQILTYTPNKQSQYQKGHFNRRITKLPTQSTHLEGIHNSFISDCCIRCNNRELVRAANTGNHQLFTKVLRSAKISNPLAAWNSYSPNVLQIILKQKDKQLLTQLIKHMTTYRQYTREQQFKVVEVPQRLRIAQDSLLLDIIVEKMWNDKMFQQLVEMDIDTTLLELFLDCNVLNVNQKLRLQAATPYAIRAGNLNVATFLMARAAKLNLFNVKQADVNILLRNTIPKNSQPMFDEKITALHVAAINPNTTVLSALLDQNSEILKDKQGRTPMHYAAACTSTQPLELLVRVGYDPNQQDDEAQTPLMIAAKFGRHNNIKYLLQLVSPHSAALELACLYGHLNCVKLLVVSGQTETALLYAARGGHLDVVKYLLQGGVSILLRDGFRMNVVHCAAQQGNVCVLAYVLKQGADFKAKDVFLNQPLHYAAAYGYGECVTLLLQAGADASALNSLAHTPLAVASMKHHVAVMGQLLNSQLDQRNIKGRTVLDFEIIKNDWMSFKNIKMLVQNGAIVNTQDELLMTSLHHAAFGGNIEIILFLILQGAIINSVDYLGRTPLQLAILGKQFEAARTLVNLSGNPLGCLQQLITCNTFLTQEGMGFMRELCEQLGQTSQPLCEQLIMQFTSVIDAYYGIRLKQITRVDKPKSVENGDDSVVECIKYNEQIFLRLPDDGIRIKECQEKCPNYTLQCICGKYYLIRKLVAHLDYIPRVEVQDGVVIQECNQIEQGIVGILRQYMHWNRKASESCVNYVMTHYPKESFVKQILPHLGIGWHHNFAKCIQSSRLYSLDYAIGLIVKNERDENGDTSHSIMAMRGLNYQYPNNVNRANKVPLFEWIRRQNVPEALMNVADPNYTDLDNRNALHHALMWRHFPIIKVLLSKQVDTEQQDKYLRTPVFYLFINNNDLTDTIQIDPIDQLMIVHPNKCNTIDKYGRNILHYAAQRGSTMCGRYLLKIGVNMNQVDIFNNTPLSVAQLNNHYQMTMMLLDSNANHSDGIYTFNPTPDMIKSPTYQRQPQQEQVIRIKRGHKLPDYSLNNLGVSNTISTTQDMLRSLADICHSQRIIDELSPLSLAIKRQQQDLVKILLIKGYPILQSIMETINTNYLDYALQLAPDLKQLNTKKQSIFHLLAAEQTIPHENLIKVLKQADLSMIHLVDIHKRNALHYAAISGSPFMIELCLNSGVDRNLFDETMNTPFSLYLQSEHQTGLWTGCKIDIQFKVQGQLTSTLIYLMQRGKLTLPADLHRYIECGCDINCKDHNGHTLLHAALQQQNLDIVYEILNHPTFNKLYHIDNEGRIPTYYAVQLQVSEKIMDKLMSLYSSSS